MKELPASASLGWSEPLTAGGAGNVKHQLPYKDSFKGKAQRFPKCELALPAYSFQKGEETAPNQFTLSSIPSVSTCGTVQPKL